MKMNESAESLVNNAVRKDPRVLARLARIAGIKPRDLKGSKYVAKTARGVWKWKFGADADSVIMKAYIPRDLYDEMMGTLRAQQAKGGRGDGFHALVISALRAYFNVAKVYKRKPKAN